MEIKLPYFYMIDKEQNGLYNNVYCTKDQCKINKTKLISAHDFLMFLSYLPISSEMSSLSHTGKYEYETFTIFNKEKVLYRVKLFNSSSVSVKCYVANITWNKESKKDGYSFIFPELGFSKHKQLFETVTIYNHFTDTNENSEHPFLRICHLFHYRGISSVLNEFIKKYSYSRSGKYKIENKSQPKKNVLTKEYFQQHGGHFLIRTTLNEKFTMKYEQNSRIHSLAWIESHVLDVLKQTNFVELDCSFYVFSPYVYSIPQAIICNESVPLGLIIGPSETSDIYSLFYDFLKKCDSDAYNLLKNMPILSDEGQGLKKFANDEGINQFFCFRHIIQKFGSGTPVAAIVRDLLYSATQIDFDEYIEKHYEKIISVLQDTDFHQLKKFTNLFGFEPFPFLSDMLHKNVPKGMSKTKIERIGKKPLFPTQSLWMRQIKSIATCSNHSESMHGKLNSKVRSLKNKNFVDRFDIVFKAITNRMTNSLKRKNLQKFINKLKDQIEEYKCAVLGDGIFKEVLTIRFESFYSKLYGTEIPLDPISIQNFKIQPFKEFEANDDSIFVVETVGDKESWLFSEKSKNEEEIKNNDDEIPEILFSAKVRNDIHQSYVDIEKRFELEFNFEQLINDPAYESAKKEIIRFMNLYSFGLSFVIDAVLFACEIRPTENFSPLLTFLIVKWRKQTEDIILSRFPSLSIRVKSTLYYLGLGKDTDLYVIEPKNTSMKCFKMMASLKGWFYEKLTLYHAVALIGSHKDFCEVFALNADKIPHDTVLYAIAGGNKEIIEFLFKNKYSFDYTFKIAVIYHRNELFDLLLNIGKQKPLDEETCNALFNHKAYMYIQEHIDKFEKE